METKILTVTSHNLQVLLTKAMCEIFVILANGQRCSMLLSAMQLQEMIVGIFKEEVQKMLIKKGK